jgi:hypothetical protein
MKKSLIVIALLVLVGAGCAEVRKTGPRQVPSAATDGSAAGGTQPEGTPAVNDTPDADIDLGTSTAPAQGIAVGEPNPSAPAPGPTRAVKGEIVAIDLDRIAFDGPALLTIRLEDGAKQDIQVPSFGFGLCAAKDAIADVYGLKVGAAVAVRGEAAEDGAIVPCASADHYLRLEKN